MTDRNEILRLQDKARKAGRVANLAYDDEGRIDGVFYLDAKGGPRARAGYLCPPLAFAELEREKIRLAEIEQAKPITE